MAYPAANITSLSIPGANQPPADSAQSAGFRRYLSSSTFPQKHWNEKCLIQ